MLKFGAALAGVVLVTVNPALRERELLHVLGQSRATGIFYAADHRGRPFPLRAAMQQQCPVAHSDNTGGSWMVTRYEDVRDSIRDAERFSSRSTEVGGPQEYSGGLLIPPITSDPPAHRGDRNRLMPYFQPARIAELEPAIRSVAREWPKRPT